MNKANLKIISQKKILSKVPREKNRMTNKIKIQNIIKVFPKVDSLNWIKSMKEMKYPNKLIVDYS